MMAILNDCGTYPDIRELFIILKKVSSVSGVVFLSRFVGTGSNRHVEGFDEDNREVISGMSIGVKDSGCE